MQAINKLLEDHNIEVQVRASGVYALQWSTLDGVPIPEYINITDWTVEDANRWLGY